jgi:spermidine synthase
LSKTVKEFRNQAEHEGGGRWLLPSVGALGVSCVATQLVLMRELLCAFAGNELVLGVVLGNWLLLMGAGAWLGRRTEKWRNPLGAFIAGQILIALVPVAQVFAARVLRNEIFTRGAAIGVHETVASSFVVLLPYCVIAGFLLTLACAIRSKAGDPAAGAGRVYVADSAGSIVGGVVFGLVLVWVVNSFALLAAAGFLNLAFAALLAGQGRRRVLLMVAMAGVALLAVGVFVFQPDASTTKLQHPSEEVLFRGSSPYGQLVVTRAHGQINFILNGLPALSTHNTEQVEEAVHYAMAQRADARRVLLIGGGVAGTAKELLKYRAEVTYVELDPLFLKLGRRFLPENLADRRLTIVNTDGRRFLQTTREQFDVILVDLADPVTAQLNRFHTVEFFAEAKRALATNGVLALAVGRYENFVSPELARLLATAHRTLRSAFTNVVMLPGGRVFFLASDGALGLDIAERLERAPIRTRFVNRHYLEAMLTPDRLADLQRAVAQDAAVNRDFNPVLYFLCLRHWASQFHRPFGVVEIALGLALLGYVARLRGAAAAVFASGFAASSLEVVLLLGFQALCGSLYYQLGIIVTVFMAGLAVGAAWANRGGVAQTSKSAVAQVYKPADRVCASNLPTWKSAIQQVWKPARRGRGNRSLLLILVLALAVFAAVLPMALKVLSGNSRLGGSTWVVQVTIGLLTFALAVLTGAVFPVANRAEGASAIAAVSRVYTADFVGASVGALLASAWLIPVLGVTMMCWLAAGLNLLGAAEVWRANLSGVAASRQSAALLA